MESNNTAPAGLGVAELAVVIAAYKRTYLDQLLASLSRQTDARFTVYIGDDASPEDLRTVVDKWAGVLNIHYVRFSSNLGGYDLVAQWTRCIELSSEPWIWLLGDDNEAEAGCVEAWRSALGEAPRADLFHFDVNRIDGEGRVIQHETAFPARLSVRRFLRMRFLEQLGSYAPDFIFSRSSWAQQGGFQAFPLAWCSDDATWVKLGTAHGIHAVSGARLRWRLSGLNISRLNEADGQKKLRASIAYVRWLHERLLTLSREAGDPTDEQIVAAARWWLFKQYIWAGASLGVMGWLQLAKQLRGLQGHSIAETLLRACLSDWRLAHHRRHAKDNALRGDPA